MIPTITCEPQSEGVGVEPTILVGTETNDFRFVELFLDKENLQLSMADRGVLNPDWQGLVWHIAGKVAEILNARLIGPNSPACEGGTVRKAAVSRGTVWAFASQPVNCHPSDVCIAEAVANSLDGLRQLDGFRVQVWPRDLHGRPMASLSDPESRREKFVDGAVSTLLTKRCMSADPPAIIVMASGDADHIPALKTILEDHPTIEVFVAAFTDALSSDYRSGRRVDVTWQHQPILLDGWLADQGRHSQEKLARQQVTLSPRQGVQHMTSLGEHGVRDGCGAGGRWPGARDLQVGQMAVSWPMFARLEVYTKKASGQLGATVVCDEDGGKYGVTLGVMKRYPELGSYAGWVWVDRSRMLAFRFDAGEAATRPAPLLAIQAGRDRAEVDSRCWNGLTPEQGALVAFRARVVGSTIRGQLRRRVTQILPLDKQHVLVIANMIWGRQFVFPDHSDVLPVLFEALAAQTLPILRNRDLLDAALERLSEYPGVPNEFQMLARVERSKLAAPARGHVVQSVPPPGIAPQDTGGSDKPEQTSDGPPQGAAPGDVVQVKLQLD